MTYADLTARAPGRILLVEDRRSAYVRVSQALAAETAVDIETNPQEALFRAAEGDYDLVLISMGLEDYDALRLCSQLRSLDRTRLLPILLIADPDEGGRLSRGLELGINDYLIRPIDAQELIARCRTQIRRKRYTDRLRASVLQTMELAITDALTGLYNRRYLDSHLAALVERASEKKGDLSLLIVDIDYFKRVNDTHGHDAGDEILREFATRIRRNLRALDLPCRFGGEEFVIVMPETDYGIASIVAERLRTKIARDPFAIHGGAEFVDVTISVGAAYILHDGDTPESLLKRADNALYRAKAEGRNRVVLAAA